MEKQDLVGSWQLLGIEQIGEEAPTGPPPFGGNPKGFIHYLPDGRMAVFLQNAIRPPIDGGRSGGSDADWRGAAQSLTAYAGTYTVTPGQVVHHVEMNSFPNDVDVDYVRLARLEGDRLVLETPPDLPVPQRPMRLIWKKYTGQEASRKR